MMRQSDAYEGMPMTFRIPVSNIKLCDQPIEPNVFWVQDRLNVSKMSPDRL